MSVYVLNDNVLITCWNQGKNEKINSKQCCTNGTCTNVQSEGLV